jgi:hypothetical protein
MNDREKEIVLSQELAQELVEEFDLLAGENGENEASVDSHKMLIYKLKKLSKITDEILSNIRQEESRRLTSHI